jgi:hypothetical protein
LKGRQNPTQFFIKKRKKERMYRWMAEKKIKDKEEGDKIGIYKNISKALSKKIKMKMKSIGGEAGGWVAGCDRCSLYRWKS